MLSATTQPQPLCFTSPRMGSLIIYYFEGSEAPLSLIQCCLNSIFIDTQQGGTRIKKRPRVNFLQYFTMPPHSMWNPHGIKILNEFHVESIWNMFQPIIEVFSTMDSTWIPHGFHVDCVQNILSKAHIKALNFLTIIRSIYFT